MLQELEIRDFALIEHLCVPFTAGFNILTGETGAGKSIIIDALNVVLGGKVGASVIRLGKERASIEASFALNSEISGWLKQNELFDESCDNVVITREITKSGSKIRINGTLVNVNTVQELRHKLVTIHTQHEARTLQSSQAQLDMLDALADDQHKKLLTQVKTLHAKRKELSAQIAEINVSEEERRRRLDFANFQQAELLEAELQDADEDDQIASRIKVLSNVVELESALQRIQQFLVDGDDNGQAGALELVQKALTEIFRISEMDSDLAKVSESVNNCLETLEEEQRALRKYRERLDTDPEALSDLEARLAVLASIKRKYGPTLEDAIQRRDELQLEVEKLSNLEHVCDELNAEQEKTIAQFNKAATDLSKKRKQLAQAISTKIQSQLADLGMPQCKFEIVVEKVDDSATLSNASGMDKVDFLIAPNPGQPLLPVGKIASGGELSRVMLAVKSIFASADRVATVIFDEIEAGLSGRVLQAMRDRLAQLASSHQILCITHQPIIASIADNHVEVSKEHSKDSTSVSATILSTERRIKAVAGMASGQEDQSEAIKFAEALFTESARVRANLG